ncbi:MAG: WD40 repeat domain-containing protein [Ignavibacteriae bacterium]|nr:WD40 repeat domain-containing protein [Ignavibacteriota bacterium]
MKHRIRILALSAFVLCSGAYAQRAEDVSERLYDTQIAAAEALIQLDKISEAAAYLHATEPARRGIEWRFLRARLDQSDTSVTLPSGVTATDLALHPSGTRLAAAASDSTVLVLSFPDLRVLQTLRGHRGSVSTVAYSGDGHLLASGGRDHAVLVWDAASGALLARNDTSFSQGIYSVEFHPDSKRLGVVSWERLAARPPHIFGFAKLIDARSGAELLRVELDNHPASGIVFTPDGSRMVLATWGENTTCHDVATGRELWRYDLSDPAEYNACHALDIHPDGSRIALGSTDRRVTILDVRTGAVLHRIESWAGHTKTVKCVRFSPDGRRLATTGEDERVLVFDTDGYTRAHALTGHTASATGLAWSRGGDSLLSTSVGGHILLWDLARPFERHREICNFGPWQTPFTEDGRVFLAPCSDTSLVLYDAASGREVKRLGARSGLCGDISSDGRLAVTASFDGVVRLWDLTAGRELRAYAGHKGRVDGVSFVNGDRFLASVGDTTLRIWPVDSDAAPTVRSLSGRPFRVLASPDGSLLYIGFSDGLIQVLEAASLRELRTLRCARALQELAVSADGAHLAVFSGSLVELWDPHAGERRHTLRGHARPGYAVGFSPDGVHLVTGSYDQTVRFWDVRSGRCVLTYHGVPHDVYTAKLLPSGALFLSSGDGHTRYFRTGRED